MAVCGLFSPVMRVLRCIIASRLAQSAMGRQPTTGSEYAMSQVTGSSFLSSRDFGIVELRVQTALFAVSVKPEVVVS